MKTIKRREFIKSGISTAAMLSAPCISLNCEKNQSVFESRKQVEPFVLSNEYNAHVSAILGDNLDHMTRDAIDAIGGMKTIVNPGETVFVKPNFVSFPWAQHNHCFEIGECTKPEILIAIADECLNAGASEVIIGEGSHLPTFDWKYAITLDGKKNLVDEAKRLSSKYDGNVTLACLENDSPGWVDVPSQFSSQKITISNLVSNADKVISVPVAKTHSWAQLTLATKNFLGITPLSKYAQWVDNSWWNRGSFNHRTPQAIAQVYLDIVNAIKADLSIIDFSIGLEGDGPTTGQGGTTVNMKERLGSWAIIASRDIMAADATAARIMSHDVNDMKQLTLGFNMGLGEIREEAIQIVGESLSNCQVDWKAARLH